MEVREIKGMKGLFSTQEYKIGQLVCEVIGEEIEAPTRTSLQLGGNKHIDVKAPIMYINHNCNANITLKNDTFVAKKLILKGDEITFDYNDSEEELSDPFLCRDCGEMMKGRKFMNELTCKK